MREDLKQGLTAAAGGMLVITALTLWKRHQWESTPREKAEGKVVSCRTGTDGEGRGTYTTEYAFKDAIGADWKMTTRGIRYCLPPGSALNVEWLQGRPETAQAWEKK